jgi:hypothetical protein
MSRPPAQGHAAETAKIIAKVVAVSRRPQGGIVLTLDNDQVWAEQDPGGYFPLKVGDSVTVKPGLLGGYLLTVPSSGHGSIRVKREN